MAPNAGQGASWGKAKQGMKLAMMLKTKPSSDGSEPAPTVEESRKEIWTEFVAEYDFGVAAFAEAVFRIFFTYLSFYGNPAQQSQSSYGKATWGIAYLESIVKQTPPDSLKRGDDKENLTVALLLQTDKRLGEWYTKATPEEWQNFRAWVLEQSGEPELSKNFAIQDQYWIAPAIALFEEILHYSIFEY